MTVPFTRTEFFEAFALYHEFGAWAVALLWLVSCVTLALLFLGRCPDRLWILLTAALWAWSGVAYHAAVFSRINPLAWAFAASFVLQAALLAGHAIPRARLHVPRSRDGRRAVGGALALLSLLYPWISIALVHAYPAAPTFGVPCPTTLWTAGLLVAAGPVPRRLLVVPIVWSAIGGSGAFLFGVAPDLALIVAGALLAFDATARPQRGERRAR